MNQDEDFKWMDEWAKRQVQHLKNLTIKEMFEIGADDLVDSGYTGYDRRHQFMIHLGTTNNDPFSGQLSGRRMSFSTERGGVVLPQDSLPIETMAGPFRAGDNFYRQDKFSFRDIFGRRWSIGMSGEYSYTNDAFTVFFNPQNQFDLDDQTNSTIN